MQKSAGKLLGLGLTGLLTAAVGSAHAQVRINEIFNNPPGSDNGQEFFELLSDTANFDLSGLTLVVIEGDGTAAGTVDQALSLSGLSTGSNGLFLWRDSATVLNPAPDAGTTVKVQDFNPDIENGSNTYFLVSGFTGTIGTDYDTNDDGILDSTIFTSVLDAIGVTENDAANSNVTYSNQFGGTTFVQTAITPDAIVRLANGSIVGADITGTAPGPYSNNPEATVLPDGSAANVGSFNLTPGRLNPVPGPSSVAVFALGGLAPAMALLRRRRAAR